MTPFFFNTHGREVQLDPCVIKARLEEMEEGRRKIKQKKLDCVLRVSHAGNVLPHTVKGEMKLFHRCVNSLVGKDSPTSVSSGWK